MLETFNFLMQGFQAFLTPHMLFYMIPGLLIGLLMGSIPGLSAVVGVALFLPFSYTMPPIEALVFLSSLFIGGIYGGTSSAILFNIPGDSDSAMTAIDGFALTNKGKGAEAMGMAIVATSFGGVLGALVLIFLTPEVARFSLFFGPVEYLGLALLSISVVSSLTGSSQLKSGLSALFGLFLSTVGLAPFTGQPRFALGITELQAGLDFVPVMIGLFAISEVLDRIDNGMKAPFNDNGNHKTSVQFPKFNQLWELKSTFIRPGIIGVIIGSLPGIGATVASVVGYTSEVRINKNGNKMGTGVYEGVVAPQSASASAAVGTFIPLLALGIPGGAVAAMLIGVFQIHGIQPGPLLFVNSKELCYVLFASLLAANLLITLIALLEVKTFIKLLKIPQPIMLPLITLFAFIGAYASNNRISDILVMLIFGIIGYGMKKWGYSIPALVLAIIIGPILEPALIRTMLLCNGEWTNIFNYPVAVVSIIIAVVVFLGPIVFRNKNVGIEQADAEYIEK